MTSRRSGNCYTGRSPSPCATGAAPATPCTAPPKRYGRWGRARSTPQCSTATPRPPPSPPASTPPAPNPAPPVPDPPPSSTAPPVLDAAAFDAAELATRLARGEARLFRLGLYLTVHGSSLEDLAERVTEVRNLAASLLLDTATVTWRQLQGWITCLPLGYDAVGMRRVFDTDALAACFPFTSPDLPLGTGDAGMGVLFGLNLASSGVVVWDRWAQDNYNAVILARSGAGKSYLAKLDLLRNLYLGVEAFVIDPEDEYLALAETVGGTIIRPGAPGVRINPLDLNPGDGEDALYRRTQFMQTFTAVATSGGGSGVGSLSPDEAAALDDAVLAAYRAKGITTDPRTWRRPAPLLADVVSALPTFGEAGRPVAGRLRPYVAGSFKTLFDGPTTTASDGHLVV